MQLSSETIDQIVRNVMRQMQSRPAANGVSAPAAAAVVAAAGSTAATTSAGAANGAGAVRIDCKVISEQVLTDAKAAGRSVSVPPGAVITPSGRDYIRRNAVRMNSCLTGSGGPDASGTLLMIGLSKVLDSAGAAAGWRTTTAATEFDAATVAAARSVSGIVVCAGGEPSVVACLLNRHPAMRAAVITRGTNLLSLTAVMNPRVLCLDSTDWSFGELLRLLRSLKSSAVVPEEWREIPSGAGR